jgi:hypothetical protein
MGQGIFTVVLLENQWKVRFRGKHSRPYANQREAIIAAIDAAHAEGKTSPDGTLVRVQSTTNAFRTVWTFGSDPYPPLA